MLIDSPVISDQSVQLVVSKLDALAQKLGVTAEFIFKIYVKQAYIEGIKDGFMTFLFASLSLGIAYGSYRLIKQAKKENSSDDWPYITANLGGTVSLGLLIVCICFLYTMIGEVLNPQFWALQNIFQAIK